MGAIQITPAVLNAALKATAAKTGPKDADPFRKGDLVVYRAHGVGRVDRVSVEEIAGQRLNLIHISFDEMRLTLRVPVAQARAAGLRKLETSDTIAEALAILKGKPRTSRAMWAKRAQEYPRKDPLGSSEGAGRGCAGPAERRRWLQQQLQPAQSVRAGAGPVGRGTRGCREDRQGGSGRRRDQRLV